MRFSASLVEQISRRTAVIRKMFVIVGLPRLFGKLFGTSPVRLPLLVIVTRKLSVIDAKARRLPVQRLTV